MHSIANKLRNLDEGKLSILTSLVAGEHCILAGEHQSGEDLAHDLLTVCYGTFGLQPVLVRCTSMNTIDDFNEAILTDYVDDDDAAFAGSQNLDNHRNSVVYDQQASGRFHTNYASTDRRIASVIIVADLDAAAARVQVQVIELLRTKRVFTRNGMFSGPKDLLVIATLSNPAARLTYHLNDMFAISYLNWQSERHDFGKAKSMPVNVTRDDIIQLRHQATQIRLTAEMDAFLHDIVISMRMSRYFQAGVTATATRHFRAISKALAPLHGVSFVTPTMIVLAARQIYPHRVLLATSETEKTLQWGSHPQAVQQLLEGTNISMAIDDVIASVETPL